MAGIVKQMSFLPNASESIMTRMKNPMRLTVLLFDGFTALDVVGGYEVLARLPGATVEFAAAEKGPVAADTRALGMIAYRTFTELVTTDVLYVPGGPGVDPALTDRPLLDCIRRLHATAKWTIGVCNGVGLLAAAGLLEGKTATTAWDYRERLAAQGVDVVRDRYHRNGSIITAAGVSASIDGALFLAGLIGGEDLAKAIQLGIEYYPSPPFGGSSADDVPGPMKDLVRGQIDRSVDELARSRAPF